MSIVSKTKENGVEEGVVIYKKKLPNINMLGSLIIAVVHTHAH